MLNLSSIMLGSTQPTVMAEFYQKVFDKEPDMSDGGFTGWVVGSTFLGVGEHSEVDAKAKEPQRLIFNFDTKDVKEEFERIKAISGATVVKEPYQMGDAWIATFADPDGNYFQLTTPWEDANQ